MTTPPTPLSLEDLPRDLSRQARAALVFCLLRCRTDTFEIEAKDGMTPYQRIAKWCGWDDVSTARRAVAELEKYNLVRRSGTAEKWRLTVIFRDSRAFSPTPPPACEVCGDEPSKMRGARRCPRCNQGKRREWKAQVMGIVHEAWRSGVTDDSLIIQRCYNTVRRVDTDGVMHAIPRWGRVSDEGGAGGRDGGDGAASEGLVPAMVEMGLIDESWLDTAKRARRGGHDEGEE